MSVSSIIQNKIMGNTGDFGIKTVTVRLSLDKYAELSVLSKELGCSPSGLLRELSEDSISEAIQGYMHLTDSDINADIASCLASLQIDEAT